MADEPRLEKGREEALLRTFALAGDHLPYGTVFGFPQFDFYDANTPLLALGIDEKERAILRELNHQGVFSRECTATNAMALEEVAQHILEEETTFDLSAYRIVGSTGGARHAIQGILQELVTPERPYVFYASPNWIFDNVVATVSGAVSVDVIARTADEFVGRLESAPVSFLKNAASVILVDPANPLGYRYTREHIERIESLAATHGIVPIFDDVFRGLQAPEDRRSSSEYASRSIIVESTSKRFGPRSLGATWSLIPKSLLIEPRITSDCKGCLSKAARMIEALHDGGYENRMRETIAAIAEAFRQGYQSGDADNSRGYVVQAFPGMPVMTFHFVQPLELKQRQIISQTLGMTSGIEWVCHTAEKEAGAREGTYNHKLLVDELAHGFSYMRICPTKETPDRAFYAGMLLAMMVKDPSVLVETDTL